MVRNLDGKIYDENDDYVSILSNHIINPVKFTECIKTMLDEGIDTFIEVGPGKTLANLTKKIAKELEKEITVLNISDVESFKKTVEIIKEKQ